MNGRNLMEVIAYLGLLVACMPVLGGYMAGVFAGRPSPLARWLVPIERGIYQWAGTRPDDEMSWRQYFLAVLTFNVIGIVTLTAMEMTQAWLPLNPQRLGNVPLALALNTAVSFVTNTNWQAYEGESTLSYLTQTAGLDVHNFLSAATGIAVLLAVVRGITRSSVRTLGSFWVDLTRAILYVLLPLSLVLAVVLVSQGVVQTFRPYAVIQTVQGTEQSIPLGPVASQVAVKQLGTNGGGFFGQNGTHPFENPTPLTNFLEMFGLIIIAASMVYAFGLMVGDRRHARCLFGIMLILLISSFGLAWWAETRPNPVVGGVQPLLEGKEVRFGVSNSVLWATATTGTSCGAVNSMHDSFMPLAGLAPLWSIMLGCIAFGGVGAGMYGMLMHVLIAVFIAGLMVGRTPEYLGKKVQAWEAGWAVVAILIPNTLVLLGSAVACSLTTGLSGLANGGPHGLGEILYAFASASNNNGSAFAGLHADTAFYNLTLGTCMFIGRFGVILAVLAVAGGLAAKKTLPVSAGTFPTHGLTFAVILLGVIWIVGSLTFLPALCLGPIVEHGLMQAGRVF